MIKIIERIKFRIAMFLDRFDYFCWAYLVLWVKGSYKLLDCKSVDCKDKDVDCYCGKFKGNIKTENDK